MIRGDVVLRIPDPEMNWSKGALRELDALSASSRAVIRVMVEARARKAGKEVILPDTAIPAVEKAKAEVEATGQDVAALAALIKQVCGDL